LELGIRARGQKAQMMGLPYGQKRINIGLVFRHNTGCDSQPCCRSIYRAYYVALVKSDAKANEKALRETQTLRAGCSKAEPKNFAPPQTSFPGCRMAKI